MDVTGLLLAGGRGTRMGTVDKGLQAFGGKPLAQHVLERLRPQVQGLLVNANQNWMAYAALGAPVLHDVIDGFAGPLAGLHAGLLHCATPLLMTVPCDSPFLPSDLVVRLKVALLAQDADAAIAITSNGATYQPQPVFALVKTSLLPQLAAFLSGGGRKVAAWYATLKVAGVEFADEAAFRNINTLDELRALQQPRQNEESSPERRAK